MESDLPESPTGSRFGWPKPARVEEFAKLLAQKPTATTRIVFLGKNTDLPIIRIPIDLPKYRLENGRTASSQSEYLARNKKAPRDLFSGDPELWTTQEAQHKLLLDLSRQSDLRQYFEDTRNIQVDPIILDENGFVVNGNRRLSTWRDLSYQNKKYEHFLYIDVAVLPHCPPSEIDLLEASLQIEKDIRADYSWHAEANMMLYKQQRGGLSVKQLEKIYKIKESNIEEILDMRRYADEYLKSRGQADLWSLVSDHEFAFRKLVQGRQKIKGIGSQEVFKQSAFVLIDNPSEAGGRLYDAIPAIADSLDVVKQRLTEAFAPEKPEADPALDELFGGGGDNTAGASDVALAEKIQKPENVDRARSLIVEVIESQKQLKRDSKTAGYLLGNCAKANALLKAAVQLGLRPDANLKGVESQLVEMELQIQKIRKHLAENATD